MSEKQRTYSISELEKLFVQHGKTLDEFSEEIYASEKDVWHSFSKDFLDSLKEPTTVSEVTDTLDLTKGLLPSDEIVKSLIALRDNLWKDRKPYSHEERQTYMLYCQINSCLYRRPDGSTIKKVLNDE